MAKKIIIITHKRARNNLNTAQEAHNSLTCSPESSTFTKNENAREAIKNDEASCEEAASTKKEENVPTTLAPIAQSKEPFYLKTWFLILISLVFGTVAMLFGSSSTSPLFVGIQFGANDFDPSFFLYLGYSFTQGVKPYLGAFDQKGLYIYTFEALGYLIGGRVGVFFLQVILAWITCSCLMILTRKFLASPFETYFVGSLYCLVMICFKFGNHSGELLSPWIALGFLFYFLGIKSNKSKYFLIGSFFAGLEAAFAIGSRPSEAMWGLALVIFYFIYWIRHKTGWHLLWNALICVLGLAIPLSVYCLIAYKGGYLTEMYNAVFVQGIEYIGNHNDSFRTLDLIFTCIGVVIFVGLTYFIKKKHGWDAFLIMFISLTISGIFNIIIARFPHYWLSSIPAIIIEMALIFVPFKVKDPLKLQKAYKPILLGINAVSVVVCCLWVGIYYIPSTPLALPNDGEISSCYAVNEKTRRNLDVIKSEGGDVFLVDSKASSLLYLETTSKERFFTNQSWWSQDNDEVLSETLSYINGDDKPTWIICDKKTNFEDAINPEIYSAMKSHYSLYMPLIDDYYLTYYHVN